MGAFLGIILHAIGGFAAGTFYIPMKFVKKWSWESAWMVLGFAAWILSPWIMAGITTPHLLEVLAAADSSTIFYTFLFGLLWGVGALTFGLTMRYLGVSLGMAVALGFTAAFGTLVPPIFDGTIMAKFETTGGLLTMGGILLVLIGIGFAGYAGMLKEKELSPEKQKEAVEEFDLWKGLGVGIFSGILSASFSFALTAGAPIAKQSLEYGTRPIFQNNAVLVWVLLGGITTNFIWTTYLSAKNKSFSDFSNSTKEEDGETVAVPLKSNYLFAALGGITWYLQFFFYGMGHTYLSEKYGFASWTLHMGFIIVFSTLWGVYFKEWKGISFRTSVVLWTGLAIIIFAIIMIGSGSYIDGMLAKH